MKKIVKNKKILIYAITTLILISLIVGGIFFFSKDNEEKTQNKETTNNYVAYVKINPLIKIEYSQTCKNDTCNDPIVTKYELVNDDAKDIYKDIDLIGTNNNLYDVITLISKTAEENNIEFENVEIYSNWDNLNNYIDNSNKDNYKWSYIVNVRDKENLEDISSSLEQNKVLYNVEFETDGGNEINTQTIEKGNLVKQPTTPTKKGYKFIEWQLNGKKFDFKQEINSDIKLTAKWEKIETSNNNSNNTENNTKPNNNNNNNSNTQNNNNSNSNNQSNNTSNDTNTENTKPNNEPIVITKYTSTINKINLNDNILVNIENTGSGCVSYKFLTQEAENEAIAKLDNYSNGFLYSDFSHYGTYYEYKYLQLSANNENLDSSYYQLENEWNNKLEQTKNKINEIFVNATPESTGEYCGYGPDEVDILLTEDLCNKFNLPCSRW